MSGFLVRCLPVLLLQCYGLSDHGLVKVPFPINSLYGLLLTLLDEWLVYIG